MEIKKLIEKAKKCIPTAILLAGMLLISYGMGEIYEPARSISFGVLTILALLFVDFD